MQGTYTHLRGENFNFDTLQINQAASTNFMRKSESAGVKSGKPFACALSNPA